MLQSCHNTNVGKWKKETEQPEGQISEKKESWKVRNQPCGARRSFGESWPGPTHLSYRRVRPEARGEGERGTSVPAVGS